jgi:signal transduction histidine kinase
LDLAAIAAQVVTEREPAASAKGVDLGLVSEGECVLAGEREGLHALAGNLVDNAIRYTPAGGTIDVRVARDGDDVVLEVIDTGPGIPAKELERVFDRFYRVSGGGAGSGLGLAIVRRIAEEHGARVEIANRPQGGLRASVRFPSAGGRRAS